MAISEGTRIGKYELKRVIGEGGFGRVFLAHDIGLDRECALKLLLPEHTSRPEILQRFLKEARSAARIKHAGIVTVFECGVVEGAGAALDGMAYIAMELLEGQTLRERLERGPLPIEAAVEIARQVGSALGAAHAVGIVHRDLKPDNVFLVPDPATTLGERVKVLDFGIAKLAAGDGNVAHKTSTHMIFGTPRYMSPEQCKSSAKVDERSDVYSLGCILFEMVCGRPPFDGDAGELIGMHQFKDPPAPSSLRELPAALEAAITAMLAKAPADRPPTMADAIARLGARVSAASAAVRATSPVGADVAAGSEVPPTLPPDAPTHAPTPRPDVPSAELAATVPPATDDAQRPVAPVVTPQIAAAGPQLRDARTARRRWPLALGAVVIAGGVTAMVWPRGESPTSSAAVHDAAPPELAGIALVDRAAEYLTKARPLVLDEDCDAVDRLRDEARAESPLIARELERLACGKPKQRAGSPDPAKTYAVPIDGARAEGPADAKVTLVFVSEYTCPHCETARATLASLAKKYGRDLRIVYKTFFVHPDIAWASSLAACAAALQGKHAEMDRQLWVAGYQARRFDSTTEGSKKCWDTPGGCTNVVAFARELRLDIEKLKADMRGPCRTRIEADLEQMKNLGISGIPASFINGRLLSGARSEEHWTALIDEELAKATERIARGTPAAEYYQRHVLDAGLKGIEKPPQIETDGAPDPLETRDVLARPPTPGPIYAQHIAIGWDWSSHDFRSRTRTKADADALAIGLLEAARTREPAQLGVLVERFNEQWLRALGDFASMKHEGMPDGGKWVELARRLAIGEAGLVKTSSGWHVVKRLAAPPKPDADTPPADAPRTTTGAAYRIVSAGNGVRKAAAGDVVKLQRRTWLVDDTFLDTSLTTSELTKVHVTGPLRDALLGIAAGGKLRVWITEKKQGVTPFWDVGLHEAEIVEVVPAPPPPPDVAAPPADARPLGNDAFYKVLVAGPGGAKPIRDDVVRFHYEMWAADGEFLYSTRNMETATKVPLSRVPSEIADGLRQMSVGDKVRFWFPGKTVSYRGETKHVVLELELLAIRPAKDIAD